MKSSVRPASGAPRASVSRTRTVVVPTASTRVGGLDPVPGLGLHLVALAVERVLLDAVDRERPERVEADVERHALDVELREQLGREVQARGRRGRRAGRVPRRPSGSGRDRRAAR